MTQSVIVRDLETVPELGGFAAAKYWPLGARGARVLAGDTPNVGFRAFQRIATVSFDAD